MPPTQSIEYWHALKDQGVPTSLVIYPDEGHGIRDPEHTADLRKRTLAWFDRYVKGGEVSSRKVAADQRSGLPESFQRSRICAAGGRLSGAASGAGGVTR